MTERKRYMYRICLTKGEPLRYISHLEYAALLRRAICRSKLPAARTEGFNPHIRMSLASALAVGVTSDEEYMDLALTSPLHAEEVRRRLDESLPPGASAVRAAALRDGDSAVMSLVDEADYVVTAPLTGGYDEAKAAIRSFYEKSDIIFHRVTPKKNREIDMKKFLLEDIRSSLDGDDIILSMKIRVTPEGSVKPGEILSVLKERFGLPVDTKDALIRRTRLLASGRELAM